MRLLFPLMTPAPRVSVGVLSALYALALGWLALHTSWQRSSWVAIVVGILAALHGVTALLCLTGHRLRGAAWRAQSSAALAVILVLGWKLAASALQLEQLYGGLGAGLASALGAAWVAGMLALSPFAVWGVAATGGLGRPRVAVGIVAFILVVAVALVWLETWASAGVDLPPPAARPFSQRPLPAFPAQPDKGRSQAAPATCDAPPGPRTPTAFLTFAPAVGQVRVECLQAATADDLRARIDARLGAVHGPVAVDEVLTVAPLRSLPAPLFDGLLVRPALDGLCAGPRCLVPWQLVAAQAFGGVRPVGFIADLRVGVKMAAVRQSLGAPGDGVDGVTRIVTRTTTIAAAGSTVLSRLRLPDAPFDAASLRAAAAAAEGYILRAQQPDGRFTYLHQPYTGESTMSGFNIPRQAGSTVALCEQGRAASDVNTAIRRSLLALGKLAMRRDDFQAMGEGGDPMLYLGSTALSLVAFVACRPRVGPELDRDIGRMARFLLRLQRPDGTFYQRFDTRTGGPVPGPEGLYGAGQSLLALVMIEGLLGSGPVAGFPDRQTVRDAVERGMTHYADHYWPPFLRQFFFLEENWHCLAARAALPHHRHDGYERFCLDYMDWRAQLVLDDSADPSIRGGFGFGNVVPPQNTPSASQAEAQSAAITVKLARGEDVSVDRRRLAETLRFLMRQQWHAADCFACALPQTVIGGFSESVQSPQIRIDYVQHAWSGLGHGLQAMGLTSAP